MALSRNLDFGLHASILSIGQSDATDNNRVISARQIPDLL